MLCVQCFLNVMLFQIPRRIRNRIYLIYLMGKVCALLKVVPLNNPMNNKDGYIILVHIVN